MVQSRFPDKRENNRVAAQMESHFFILEVAFFTVAAIYSMTSHSGTSGYIAVMVLLIDEVKLLYV